MVHIGCDIGVLKILIDFFKSNKLMSVASEDSPLKTRLDCTDELGYSAMSGIIGGGGLGKIAIDYGYYRYKYLVMFAAVVLLIILVQIFQSLGTHLAAKSDKRLKK